MVYKIVYKSKVKKELRKINKKDLRIIIAKIELLKANPFPTGYTKLKGSASLYRIRHSDYRIIYEVNDGILIVTIVQVGHRREVYRGL